MSHRPNLLLPAFLAAVALAAAPSATRADDEDSSELAERARDLSLTTGQKRKLRTIRDDLRKAEVQAKAQIEVVEIDLRRELDSPRPNRKKVGVYVDRISRLEATMRKARINASISIRAMLTSAQWAELNKMRGHRHHGHKHHRELERARREAERARRQVERARRQVERMNRSRHTCPDEVSCLVSDNPPACCSKYKRKRKGGHLPKTLTRRDITRSMASIRDQVAACPGTAGGIVKVRVQVAPSGRVTSAVASSASDALALCVARAVRGVRLKATQRGRTFTYPFVIRQPRRRATGTLVINSLPAGATVYVDGKMMGAAPLRVRLPPGRHHVRIERAGYDGKRVVTQVRADQVSTLQVRLNQ